MPDKTVMPNSPILQRNNYSVIIKAIKVLIKPVIIKTINIIYETTYFSYASFLSIFKMCLIEPKIYLK